MSDEDLAAVRERIRAQLVTLAERGMHFRIFYDLGVALICDLVVDGAWQEGCLIIDPDDLFPSRFTYPPYAPSDPVQPSMRVH